MYKKHRQTETNNHLPSQSFQLTLHVCFWSVVWKEGSGKNPCRHTENIQALYKMVPGTESNPQPSSCEEAEPTTSRSLLSLFSAKIMFADQTKQVFMFRNMQPCMQKLVLAWVFAQMEVP